MISEIVAREVTYAPDAFRLLNGCVCLYKPPKKGFNKTRIALTSKLAHELNSMECRRPRERIDIQGDLRINHNGETVLNDLNLLIKPNLADHPLVSGPRYSHKHFPVKFANNPGWYASGLIVAFIGTFARKAMDFIKLNLSKTYEIKGEFGLASINYGDDGKVRMKTSYKHIDRTKFERILTKMESAQRSLLYKAANVRDMNSEQAYQIACGNIPRALTRQTKPIVTAIQPISFDPPEFAFQVECYNEQEMFLAELCNEIGIALRSSARCTGIRCIKHGPFNIDHSLVEKHWTVDNLIENAFYCNQIWDNFQNKQLSDTRP